MGIQIKHILIAATIFATLGFLYIMALAPIDITRSPRAAALNQTPSSRQLIANIRNQLASGQLRTATTAANQLTQLHPTNPNALLNAAYAYRLAGNHNDESQTWTALLNWSANQSTNNPSTTQRANTLYLNAWALKGTNQPDQAQLLFKQLAQLVETQLANTSQEQDPGLVIQTSNPTLAYNLACYWSLAENPDRALHYWQRAIDLGYTPSTPPWWTVDPDLENLHPHERFWTIPNQTP